MKKSSMYLVFGICMAVLLICALLCFFNINTLKKEIFQQTTSFSAPAMAKFEKDGNLYVIDNGSFRLVCMKPDGKIIYTLEIDKLNEYIRIIDGAIDEAGNLYLYEIEAEYDACLTKRDIIRKYDNRGRYVKDILSISYDDVYTNPRLFSQFGSFQCENGILSFSQTLEDKAILYRYDTFRDDLRSSEFTINEGNFLIAQLVQKDMLNFAYVQRDGNIYEVKNGGEPNLIASFDWSIENGGIYPWFIFYDSAGFLVFYDLGSASLFRLINGNLQRVVPAEYFRPLEAEGKKPGFSGFGFYEETFAGVFDDVVWLYDGKTFTMYDGDLRLAASEIAKTIIVQTALVIGIAAFIIGLIILFFGILNRYVSLFVKQTVFIIPLLIIAFIIVFTVTFNIMTDRFNEVLFNEMIAKAQIAAELVNGDDVDAIKSIKDIHSDEYRKLSSFVKEIVGYNADPWNRAYYAAIFKGNSFEYAIAISEEEWNLFRTDEGLEGEEYNAFMRGEPIVSVSELFNGTWAFADAPVYNSKGEISGMFEIGLDMTGFEIGNDKLKIRIALIVAAVGVVILLALAVIVSLVVKRLSSVAGVLQAIASGNWNTRVTYSARDELGKVSTGLNQMAEELQNQFDRISNLNESTLRFVPMQFMEQLGVSDITKMKLGDSVQRNISILFFDIRYFSISSEMMTAQQNFEFINEVLGIAGPVIRKNNGFVDKYIGDSAMALFVNGIDAVRAGIELYQKLVVDDETRVKIGQDGINIGVGVHSGSVMMGIVGENERLSSTVISPNVNLASRIESLSKQTASGLLISRDTLNQLAGHEDEFSYRFLGMIQAASVNEVVGLVDMLDALSPEVRERRLATKPDFESGVRKFHMKDYAASVQSFEKVIARDPEDVCAAYHLEEAHSHLQNPSLPSVFIFGKK